MTKKEYAERVALLALVLKKIGQANGDFRCYSTAVELIKVSDRLNNAAVKFCNGEIDEAAWERRKDAGNLKLGKLIREVQPLLGSWRLEIGGDPRGNVVKFFHPSVPSNSFGGEGYCI